MRINIFIISLYLTKVISIGNIITVPHLVTFSDGLHSALWLHIGKPMRLRAAEPRSIAGLLFPCQYLYGTIL